MNSPRVLFLYPASGSGHERCAAAVRTALKTMEPRARSWAVDTMTSAYPWMGRLIVNAYVEIIQRTPQLWDFLYDNPGIVEATQEARDLLHLISAPRVHLFITEYQPDILVCTQAMPASVVAQEKKRGKISLPVVAVITDFAVHSYWVHSHIDHYLVASEEVRRDLVRRGVGADRVHVTGIPINPRITEHAPKSAAKRELGLQPQHPAILLMGGTKGIGPMTEIVRALRKISPRLQFIIATGMNRTLHRALKQEFGLDPRVHLRGYTHEIPSLMDAADLLITKPGGLTSSEAIAKGLPMIIAHPLPGQEERNAAFLTKKGVAVRAEDLDELTQAAHALLSQPGRVADMRKRMALLARPDSAAEAARFILDAARKHFSSVIKNSF